MVSHFLDLLTQILHYTSIALGELSPNKPIRKRVQQIETIALSGKDTAKQLLVYVGGNGKIPLPVDLNDVIEGMKNLTWIASKNTSLKYDLKDELPRIEADSKQLQKLIANLVTNASDSMGDRNGLITLRTGILDSVQLSQMASVLGEVVPDTTYVYLEVSDNGRGMDEHTMKRAFDPFFTTKPGGRGIGMAEVMGVVRTHNGLIIVESGPEQGTDVKVFFPSIVTLHSVRKIPRRPQWNEHRPKLSP